MTKQIIAVDIDDVLAANAEGFVAFSNRHWGMNLKEEDYQEHWAELWSVDHDEVQRRATEIHLDSGPLPHYRSFDDAEDVLKHLSRNYRLVCATSRRLQAKDITETWIERHFPGVFETVHYAGIFDAKIVETTFMRTKKDVLLEIGASYLIDDQLKHCLSAAEAGVAAVLFGDYKWNQADDLPDAVVRCNDWAAVKEFFDARQS